MRQKRIAVFDFDEAGRRAVAEAVRGCCARDGTHAEIAEYGEISSMAYSHQERPYDMFFVVVRDMMGVEAARLIREMDKLCPIFLISQTGEYAMEGYRIHALHYLLLPVTPEGVAEAIGRIGSPLMKRMQCAAETEKAQKTGGNTNEKNRKETIILGYGAPDGAESHPGTLLPRKGGGGK